MASNARIVSVFARVLIMTALMVPFCSFSTVVSLDASAQTEQEGAVEQLSVEKMIHYPTVIDQLYQSTNYRLNWENESDVEQFIFQMKLVALADVSKEFDNQLHRINQVRWKGDNLDFDLVMTDSLLMYLSYLEQVPQEGVNWLFANKAHVSFPAPSVDTLSVLSNEITVGKLDQFLASLRSPLQMDASFNTVFASLSEFSQYQYPFYEQKGLLRVDDPIENKSTLVERMAIVGVDVSYIDSEIPQYDENLELAVKEFQRIHGLNQDGVIGPNTIRWINFSPQQRLHLLALNAERSRIWAKERDNVVFVNVPGYEVTYWHDGQPLFESKVVVGRASRKTPIMTGTLDSVILNPTWNVPWKIMVKDIIPKVKRNPMYLMEHNIQIIRSWTSREIIDPTTINWATVNPRTFPYRMRQASGSHNALGLYKFNMPNPQAIYLHDTPSKNLFQQDRRAFSSGCVRVENADQLAELLFKTQGLEERLEKKRESARSSTTSVPLGERIPVHIIYQTAWLEEGTLYYRDDIYKYDHQG
ncbi:L,D-transpeptidase family protein [Vibrio parahaemolyticus]|nr:L,D-transpeptidase family protein [Vibrio parahaemolyticus]EJG2023339.1 L,D-transpeptidase family protein [Vibrio parahaemolyticus]EJG2032611.1 L,D-transpeptidase family protein [Vibrio parahaemolyticus]KON61460.1 peptidase [Vibrio parahaemolyticus]